MLTAVRWPSLAAGFLSLSAGIVAAAEADEHHPSELGFVGGQLHSTITFNRAPGDLSGVPPMPKESGPGESESQLRFRWAHEPQRRPELFSFLEIVFPFQRKQVLIGAHNWVGAAGFGAIKGTSVGTFTGQVSLAYEDGGFQSGEYALGYLKHLSPKMRAGLMLQGEGEDLSPVGELQWSLTPHATLQLNSGFGLTQKVPDFAPEVGAIRGH